MFASVARGVEAIMQRAYSVASISSSVGSEKSCVSGDDADVEGVDDVTPVIVTSEPSLRPPLPDGHDRGGGKGSGKGGFGLYQGNWGGHRKKAEHSE